MKIFYRSLLAITVAALTVYAPAVAQSQTLTYAHVWQHKATGPTTGAFGFTTANGGSTSPNVTVNVAGINVSDNPTTKKFTLSIAKGSARTYGFGGTATSDPTTGTPLFASNSNGLGTMIEIRALVNSQDLDSAYSNMLTITNPLEIGRQSYNFILGNNKVGFTSNLEGVDFATPKTITWDTTSDYVTYQLFLTYTGARLYINGELVIDNVTPVTGASHRMELGVAAIGTPQVPRNGAGSVTYDYIAWSNNVIPEPSTISLAALSAGALIFAGRFRRRL